MTQPAYARDDADLLALCDEDRYGASGPGGQHLQKSQTAVRLTHRASGVQAICQDHRSRDRNRRDALRRLRLRLALALRGGADPEWVASRQRGTSLPVRDQASGYHLVVAVLFDRLTEHAWQPGPAARSLGLSTSQLVKVLAADKEVWQAVTRARQDLGLSPLRH